MFLELEVGIVAPDRGVDHIAVGLEIVAQQHGQGFFVLDEQDTSRHVILVCR